MNGTTPKPFVFVIMPFDSSFDDTYTLGIKTACEKAGAYCQRVDEQIFQESMLERIYKEISKADIIVADMTGKNPNVFYEAGYAHALGKSVILLTQKAEDIPFDLKHYPHIVYGGKITALLHELEKKVKYFLDHPRNKRPEDYRNLEYLLEGHRVRREKFVNLFAHRGEMYHNLPNQKLWSLSFDIHNPTDKVIRFDDLQFGLVFPAELGEPEGTFAGIMKFDTNSYMYLIREVHGAILPGGFIHEALAIVKRNPVSLVGKHLPCSVRVLSEYEPEIIDFHVVVNELPDPRVLTRASKTPDMNSSSP